MKTLKKDFQAVIKELKALTRKTEGLVKAVDKLEKAKATAKRKTKVKATAKRKTKAKAKTTKKAPAKRKTVAKKAPTPSATDQVLRIIKGTTMEKEKRQSPRVQSSLQVGYKSKDQRAPIQAESIEIGEGGIRLSLREERPEGEEAELEIHLPSGKISALGEVVWSQNKMTSQGRSFQTGMKFTRGKSSSIEKISSYVGAYLRAK
jgi:hypothetical protein